MYVLQKIHSLLQINMLYQTFVVFVIKIQEGLDRYQIDRAMFKNSKIIACIAWAIFFKKQKASIKAKIPVKR